jgi:S-adenosylmethionine/arginine decarboxylase-like enzyme
MQNYAKGIYRQRVIIEGIYTVDVDELLLEKYLRDLSDSLGMHIIYGPMVMNQASKVNEKHAGFESILVWCESGVTLYTWSAQRFFSIEVYSCAKFSNRKVVRFTKDFLRATKITWKSV